MRKKVFFSKSYAGLVSIKKDFFNENQSYLKKAQKEYKIYSKQKKRKKCKNCGAKINRPIFVSHKIDYTICKRCGHLNGIYEDGDSFIKHLYYDNKGKNYTKHYKGYFKKRVKNIYLPKINFLKNIIKEKFDILELGCGAGYFLKACEMKKIKAYGLDVNKALLNEANKNLRLNEAKYINSNEICSVIQKSKCKVFSLISTLEHLQEPNKILKAFQKSNIKYIFFNVPLLSFSVFIENVFQKINPRNLNASHTHLYSEKSLNYLAKKFNFEIIGEWWFGADIHDLFRSILLSANFKDKHQFNKHINKHFYEHIDELQNVLDKGKSCSEVHLVLKNNNIVN